MSRILKTLQQTIERGHTTLYLFGNVSFIEDENEADNLVYLCKHLLGVIKLPVSTTNVVSYGRPDYKPNIPFWQMTYMQLV